LSRRGPDCVHQTCHEIAVDQAVDRKDDTGHSTWPSTSSKVFITCASSVLSLRGSSTVAQPVTSTGHLDARPQPPFLCWNGEAWTFDGNSIKGNDSEHVFQTLSHVSISAFFSTPERHADAIAGALASYAGPFAFAFFEPLNRRLYFGRDLLGRRSLLYRHTEDGQFLLSSMSDDTNVGWNEVEADGIYFVDLNSSTDHRGFKSDHVGYCFGSDSEPARQRLVGTSIIRYASLLTLVVHKTARTEQKYSQH